MRISTIIYLAITCMVVHSFAATTYAQETQISLNLENRTLKEAFKEIEKNSEFVIFYYEGNLEANKQVSIRVKNKTVDKILDELLKDTEVTYTIDDKQIFITKKEEKSATGLPIPTQITPIYVTGSIVDNTGESVIGANIMVKNNNTRGAVSGIDGGFSIEVLPGSVLVISYIGYIPQEITVNNQTHLSITLLEDLQSLDEVVVVGYGVQKKVNLTGSVASVNAKELESRPLTNLSSGLSGLLPGVSISQSSGKPGSDGASIRIRGVGTLQSDGAAPLIIIDGIEGDMNSINPSDVESVNVLKDAASAAIYGARAANGVVLVTTKKGSRDRTTISFSSTWSQARATGIPESISDFLTYMDYMNTSATNIGATAFFGETDYKNWEYANAHPNELNEYGYPLSVAYPNTDWFEEILKKQWIQNYNLTANGGNDKYIYNISLGYLSNPGIMDNSGMERFNGRINAESKINSFLTVGTQTWFTKQNTGLGNTQDTFNNTRSSSPAVYPLYNGLYGATSADGDSQQSNNPVASVQSALGRDVTNRFVTTWYAKIDILKGLDFETKFNYTYSNQERNNYGKQFERWSFGKNQLVTPAATLSDKTSTYYYTRRHTLTVENLLRYHTTINRDHFISALLGHNEFSYHTYNFQAVGKGMIDPSLPNLSSMTEPQSVSGTEGDNSMRSFFGRLIYNYQSKYLFEANLRYDGSSKFAAGQRWGVFPSFSAGWRLDQEQFMPDGFRSFFQNFKLRGSWGKLGNNSIDNYLFQNKYTQSSSGYYSFNNSAAPGLIVNTLGNSSLKWESTRVIGAALEMNFFNQKAYASLEYYDKYTDGILYRPTVNAIMGDKSAPYMNLAEVSNRGYEITLGWNDRIKDFQYSINGNVSYNKNRVEKYKGTLTEGWVTDENGNRTWSTNFGDVASGSDNVILEGHMINEHRVLQVYKGSGNYFNTDGSVNINGGPADGMIRTENDLDWIRAMIASGYSFQGVSESTVGQKNGLYYGDLIYADINGDGKYGDTSSDRVFTGTSTTPKWNVGLNFSAEYKNFDFSMIWSGLFGAEVWTSEAGTNNNVLLHGGRINADIATNSYFFDPENPQDTRTNINGKYPRLKYSVDALNGLRSNFWLTSASFFRLKNIQLGYTIPQVITRKAYISHLRLFVSGENLLTITSFRGLDPESQMINNYPTLKQIAFGLNVNF